MRKQLTSLFFTLLSQWSCLQLGYTCCDMTASTSSYEKHVPPVYFFYTVNIFCNREFEILPNMSTNVLMFSMYSMKPLLVANLTGDYGKKILQGLTTKTESVRLPYTINNIYRVKTISTLDCGITSSSFPSCKCFLIANM